MSSICIKSDFVDFYDKLSNKESSIVYNRFSKVRNQRGTDLKYLRNMSIKTIELKPVNSFLDNNELVVVYTNILEHHGNGKKILTVADAIQNYSNCVASRFIPNNQTYIKYLQVGDRKFNMYYTKDKYDLKAGKLYAINEIERGYNRLIGLPIFSIDFINCNNEMIATDLNVVESLHDIGMDSNINAEEVIELIKNSLIAYNKL